MICLKLFFGYHVQLIIPESHYALWYYFSHILLSVIHHVKDINLLHFIGDEICLTSQKVILLKNTKNEC